MGIDANGILNVNAQDKASGKSSQITITNEKGRLSKDEIDRMVEEAEKYKADDEAQKTIESKCGETLDWMDKNMMAEKDEFEAMLKEIQAVCDPIMMKVHQQGGGMPSDMPGAGPAAGEVPEVD